MNSKKKIILSSVGVSAPRETSYSLEGKTVNTFYSSIALFQLDASKYAGAELWFIMTAESSKANWEKIEELAVTCGFEARKIDIDGNEDDVQEFLTKVAAALPEDCDVTLNITEGLRHHAFLYYGLALYLTSFKNISIKGVWYCRFESPAIRAVTNATPINKSINSQVNPLINLGSVFELSRWFYGLRSERETGSYAAIAKLISRKSVREKLETLSMMMMNGMPIEAGDKANEVDKSIRDGELIQGIPFSSEINESLRARIESLCIDVKETRKKLTQCELDRQAILIDRYFEKKQINLAFGMLREYVVSWMCLEENAESWLDRDTRLAIERRLGFLKAVLCDKSKTNDKLRKYQSIYDKLSDSQKEWGEIWDKIVDYRNKLQHHGMSKSEFVLRDSKLKEFIVFWQNRAHWSRDYRPSRGGGRLLICPLGNSPGVLYSAISHVKPERIIVICSESTKRHYETAVAKVESQATGREASEKKIETQFLVMEKPHSGVDEFKVLIEESLEFLSQSDTVEASLTGGTSLMGVLVSQLVSEARSLQIDVKQFVLIDDRNSEQQQNEPWKLGEIRYLD